MSGGKIRVGETLKVARSIFGSLASRWVLQLLESEAFSIQTAESLSSIEMGATVTCERAIKTSFFTDSRTA